MFLLHAVPTPPAHQPRGGRPEPAAAEQLATVGSPSGAADSADAELGPRGAVAGSAAPAGSRAARARATTH